MFKQYQQVELTHDMLSDELLGEVVQLHAGQRGVIVEIHHVPNVPIGYDVEFFNNAGQTVAVMIVEERDIRPLPRRSSRATARSARRRSGPQVA